MDAVTDRELVEESLALAAEFLAAARRERSGRRARRDARVRRLLTSENGTRLVFALADRVLRPTDPRAAAEQLETIATGDLSGLSRFDRWSLLIAAKCSRLAPRPIVALAATRIRLQAARFVAPAEQRPLSRRLARLRRSGERPNLNVLGEMVLGWEEADRRREAVETLLRTASVDCVSVKVSAVAPSLSLLDFEGSLERAAGPLRQLYRVAAEQTPNKLVNLDMEEHRDLDLTVELFTRLLDEPEFVKLRAGIALQAYLPDTHEALDRLLKWAAARHQAGGAPIRVRLVKGANLAMERVEAELHGWPAPTYPTKVMTDASYKQLLVRLVTASAAGTITVGVASHNLFDLAFALVLSRHLSGPIEIEMLAGMADDQAHAVAERVGRVLLYLPLTRRSDFRSAMAYLARRLDENATPDGFLRHALDLEFGSAAWEEQVGRFKESLVLRHAITTTRLQNQDRTSEGPDHDRVTTFFNEADTDLTVPENRQWARSTLAEVPHAAPAAANEADVDAAVAKAVSAAARWRLVAGEERQRLLLAAANEMARGRHAAIAVMAREAGKTFAEADVEVSEAIDYARWYAGSTELLGSFDRSLASEPLGVVVVSPPWNFPFAIPAGGVLAALAAGNVVILKPSPEARATAALLVEQLHDAGFEPDCVALVATPDDSVGERLIRHPNVDGVVLTGSWDTAVKFASWAPARRLLAETSGKNALVVSANADVDAAVRDLVRSSFGHAGQKCSAASLALVDASVYDDSPFLQQLGDATRSLRVGLATDPATEVGPIVGPMTPALLRALTQLDQGERWLVEPQQLGDRLWTPGVRIGVRPGSWAHRTEWFGPVLAVIRVSGLEEAIRCQNDVEFGLTAGLHSLDANEQRRWVEEVEAGNLYVNRPVTGAIVGRQPFGGWKRSSFGPTAKAGGPNYLLGLRRWRDREPTSVATAITSYGLAMQDCFSGIAELAGLASETNELRYRPVRPGIIIRFGDDVEDDDLRKASAAAELCGTPVRFSSNRTRAGFGASIEVENDATFAEALRANSQWRLRLLGTTEPEVVEQGARLGMTVLDEPMCSDGRLELVRWLREQAISRSLHRYGNVVYPRLTYDGQKAGPRNGMEDARHREEELRTSAAREQRTGTRSRGPRYSFRTQGKTVAPVAPAHDA
jgi:RHH-type proline utilization regulon transcriptional repressor/proline dehydrogenase/delta 1-pyrroline-5-carboxylate dehydrogenase